MKKVAILTFSNTTNYGAVLQAYALKNKLINLGYDAEVLNYNCQAVKEREKIHVFDKNIRVTIKNILLIYPKFIRKITFKKFVRRENLYTKKTYNDKNISSTNNEYDIYVVGSDQVWNLQLSGYDYHYFLNFVSENKTKVSYAASLGSDEIDFQEYSMVVKFLKKFNYIALRESSSINVLDKLEVRNAISTIDPVFLLTRFEWNDKIPKKNKHTDKYILLYFIHNGNKTFDIAKKIAKKYNYKIIYLNNYDIYRKGMKNVFSTDPFEFINLIKNAELIITGSFHGIAFSINMNKDFYYEKAVSKKNNNTRIDNLVELFGLKSRNVLELEKKSMVTQINFDSVNDKLKSYRENAENYIRSWDENEKK